MGYQEIRVRQLATGDRERVVAMLGEKAVLAEPVSAVWVAWLLLAALGVGAYFLGKLIGGGVVLPAEAVAAAFVAGGLIGMWRGRPRGLAWQPGRYLHRFGFVDARTDRLRHLPIAELESVDVQGNQGQALTIFTITARFAGGRAERFQVAGSLGNVPRAELDRLTSERDERLLVPAGEARPGGREPFWLRHAVALGGLAAAAAVVAVSLGVVAPRERARRRAAEMERVRAGRRALEPHLSGPAAAAFAPLLDRLEAGGGREVVVVLSPPDQAEMDKATRWLETQATAVGARAAPVWLYGATVGSLPGEDAFTSALNEAFDRIAPGLVWFRTSTFGGPPAGAAVLFVSYQIEPVTAYQAGRRVFAGLRCTFSATLRAGDGAPVELASGLVVDPPDSFDVTRLKFQGETLPDIGAEAQDPLEDRLVYTEQMRAIAGSGAERLVQVLLH